MREITHTIGKQKWKTWSVSKLDQDLVKLVRILLVRDLSGFRWIWLLIFSMSLVMLQIILILFFLLLSLVCVKFRGYMCVMWKYWNGNEKKAITAIFPLYLLLLSQFHFYLKILHIISIQ